MTKARSASMFALFLIVLPFCASAQTMQAKATPDDSLHQAQGGSATPSLKPELASLSPFIGNWTCKGEFASNHAPIQGDIVFAADLEGAWLEVRHKDAPPNRYVSLEMWGYDKDAKNFVAIIHDNFSGARLFTSSGWNGNALSWTGDTLLGGKKSLQRFTYETKDRGIMVVRWEVSAGSAWRLGDELTCSKRYNRRGEIGAMQQKPANPLTPPPGRLNER